MKSMLFTVLACVTITAFADTDAARMRRDWEMQDFGVTNQPIFKSDAEAAAYPAKCLHRRKERIAELRRFAKQIVYVKHHFLSGTVHYSWTDHVTDEVHPWERNNDYRMGSSLRLLTVNEDGTIADEPLLDCPGGVIRDPNISFDGKKLVFAQRMNDTSDDFHLYVMELATRKVTQITFGLGMSDIEPAFLPSGEIVFNSSRCVELTDCWAQGVSNLYVCDGDGRFLRRLTFDQVHDNYPQVLDDGRVIYTRWEYNDRSQIWPQPLFVMNGDGTAQTEFYGNNSWFPTSILHGRGVPGTQKIIAIAAGHHTQQRGKLILIDRSKGTQENAGVEFLAPRQAAQPGARIDQYGWWGEQFQYPYAFDEKHYLVTYKPEGTPIPQNSGKPMDYAIYYMTEDGARELLAYDPAISCCQAVPLLARNRPPEKPSSVDYAKMTGFYYVQNVYAGQAVTNIPRGTIKSLRVVGLEYRAADAYYGSNVGEGGMSHSRAPISINNASWDVKHVLGEVPVEADGSVFFEVPARMPVYFQLLDAKGYAVQTMRSWSTLQPGESQACVGCHESKNSAPQAVSAPSAEKLRKIAPFDNFAQRFLALKNPFTEKLSKEEAVKSYLNINCPNGRKETFGKRDGKDAGANDASGFSYDRSIQRIWEARCVACHRGQQDRPNLTAEVIPYSYKQCPNNGDATQDAHRSFSRSYLELTNYGHGSALVNWISAQSRPTLLPPYSAGAAKSSLMQHLEPSHHGVQATEAEKRMVACWLDLCVPYCGSYTDNNMWEPPVAALYHYFESKRVREAEIEIDNIRKLMDARKNGTQYKLADFQVFTEGGMGARNHFKAEWLKQYQPETPVLYVARQQYPKDHHTTGNDVVVGECNASNLRVGSALRRADFLGCSKEYDGRNSTAISTLLECKEGIIRDLRLSYDAKRVLFAMRRDTRGNYHLFEMDVDGKNLRQLTMMKDAADFAPCYLPDGRIAFSSTRELKYCGCNRHTQANLFIMNGDGTNIRQIGHNTLYETRPAVLPDGRLLYDRWEYVDRAYGPSFGLWTMYPDGRQPSLFYGNNAWSPGSIIQAQPMPKAGGGFSTERVTCVFGCCHERPWGALVVLDRRLGLDGTKPVLRSWPADISAPLSVKPDYHDGQDIFHPMESRIDSFGPQWAHYQFLEYRYEDPHPLDAERILCARMILPFQERTAVYLVNAANGEERFVLADPTAFGCYDPTPLCPRQPMASAPNQIDLSQSNGVFYVTDIYQGTGMEKVPRGSIKTLRVIEAPAKDAWTEPLWNLDTTQYPAVNYNCTNTKRILGDAPVEEDGSVAFEMPAEKFVYFQALDKNGQMVQSMRSGTSLQRGEHFGCTGCHESRYTASSPESYAKAGKLPLALRRKPSKLRPWYGPTRDFSFTAEVQPVFNRLCVTCHDYGGKGEKALNLCGDLGEVFNVSYLEIRRHAPYRWYPDKPNQPKELVKPVDDGPPEVLPAYAWGSSRSKLVDIIRSGHHGVKPTQEEFDRIVTWIDLNTPYYPVYTSNFPNNLCGRCPLNNDQLHKIVELTGCTNSVLANGPRGTAKDSAGKAAGSGLNFTRPEKSECLRGLAENDPRRAQALKIIFAGQKILNETTRADMPNHVVHNPIDLQRRQRRAANAARAEAVRLAILSGKRLPDTE